MNERIRELAEQAFDTANDGSINDIKIPKEFIEKFAQLIVAECLNQCYNRSMNDELYAGQLKAAEYIEEHFGIVE
jgi:hypothetical protein